MTTAQLVIVCVTVLAVVVAGSRALLERDRQRAQLQREVAMHERAAAAPVAELAAAVQALTAAAAAHERAAAAPVADLAAAVEALTVATAAIERSAARPGLSRLGHRVTVHTKQPDDQTIFGVVVGDYTDRIVLEDAEYVTQAGGKPMPGRPHVDTRDIAWIDDHGQVAAVPEPAEAA